MEFLETLFYDLAEEKEPDTPEYKECREIRDLLLEDIQKAMGAEMMDKVSSLYAKRESLECQRYFYYGIQLGLELLRQKI